MSVFSPTARESWPSIRQLEYRQCWPPGATPRENKYFLLGIRVWLKAAKSSGESSNLGSEGLLRAIAALARTDATVCRFPAISVS